MLINHTKLARLALLFLVLALAPATICAMEYQSRYAQAGTVPARMPTPFPGSQSHTHNYNYTYYHRDTNNSAYHDLELSLGLLSEIERRVEIEAEEKSQESSPEIQEDSPEAIDARIRENEHVYASNALESGVFPYIITIAAGRSGSTTVAKSDPQYGSRVPYGQITERDTLCFEALTHKQIMLNIHLRDLLQKRDLNLLNPVN